jgi:transposase
MLNKYFDNVYLATEPCDMRKSIDGLAAIVTYQFNLNPFSSCLFVFTNKSKNKLKMLFWQHNGFWLCYRRLDSGKFVWPKSTENNVITIGTRELNWLLDGLAIEQKQAHKKVDARIFV